MMSAGGGAASDDATAATTLGAAKCSGFDTALRFKCCAECAKGLCLPVAVHPSSTPPRYPYLFHLRSWSRFFVVKLGEKTSTHFFNADCQ
jgi:hypothetical protein